MARPGGEATRARIRQAVRDLMRTRGLDALTLDAVADEVGVTRQAVLYHFGSREGLHAVDARTARELGKLKTDEPVSCVPVVAGGVVYVSPGPGLAGGGMVILQGAQNAPPARLGGSLRALKLTPTRP